MVIENQLFSSLARKVQLTRQGLRPDIHQIEATLGNLQSLEMDTIDDLRLYKDELESITSRQQINSLVETGQLHDPEELTLTTIHRVGTSELLAKADETYEAHNFGDYDIRFDHIVGLYQVLGQIGIQHGEARAWFSNALEDFMLDQNGPRLSTMISYDTRADLPGLRKTRRVIRSQRLQDIAVSGVFNRDAIFQGATFGVNLYEVVAPCVIRGSSNIR